MKSDKLKPWQSTAQQLASLQARGLIIGDDKRALHYLSTLGYYRLSGYFYPFRKFGEGCTVKGVPNRTDEFIEQTHFDHIIGLYMFDKGLRLLAFDALERIEMSLRVDVAHVLGRHHPSAHEQAQFLDAKFSQRMDDKPSAHELWLNKYTQLVIRARNEDLVAHHLTNYGKLLIWAACEILDFGALSRLYSGMRYKDRQKISQKYGVKPEVFTQWIRSLNLVRNIVAHHGRLWNVKIINRTDFVKSFGGQHLASTLDKNKAFAYFYLMGCLLKVISPTSRWWQRLQQHLLTFPALHNSAISLVDFGYDDIFANTSPSLT